ncbi:MAG: Aspartyl/glutamyl-tRNA(Asn/Gln) amidotransferase subunit B [Phycisphaerae bacterium]|nr:Aspartyl/glutamyl-tRNA(Asn/Gln) amidotransferase subunit B [Phycisphaerae bacterium]
MQYKSLIGMEIHVQLLTRTKLFCGCEVQFGTEPNTRVCPVCVGLPGSLPAINLHAVELAIRAGLALQCTIAGFTKWDRKSYYYPDLPKNYQISQYDLPIASQGILEYELHGERRPVRIRRAHLEEDAGKNLHDSPGMTQVDLNRTGTPLLEIVTEPDLHSAEEAFAFANELHRLLVYLGVTEGVMKKAQMRFEPNVNVIITHEGVEYATPICEVKNLNSFKALRSAVDFELQRQLAEWQRDHDYTLASCGKENRGWDDDRQETVYQRGKEEAHDYRYFPDPDLIPIVVDDAWQECVRKALPEMPLARRNRFMQDYGLGLKEATLLIEDRPTADLLDAAVKAGGPGNILAKHFISFWQQHANSRECTIAQLGVTAPRLAELANLQQLGRISSSAAATLSEALFSSDQSPAEIARQRGLEQVQDRGAIERLVDDALADNPQAVELIRLRDKKWEKSLGFLQGQVMQKSKGSASPILVREILMQKLDLNQG